MSKIFQEAFVATIARYKLQVKWLGEESGVSTATITRLKTGARDIYLESFADIFEALPVEAKRFFLEKLMGDAIASTVSLPKAIEQLDPEKESDRKQAADAFRLIGEKFIYPSLGKNQSQVREITDEPLQLTLLKSP